ncbi:MAG: AAA family ATPase [Anaerolineae bacterium]
MLLLGPAQFIRNGQPVELSAAKAVALLAYLAVRGAPQTREHLTDLLWPDSPPDAARKNLRNILWTIRKTLGEDVLSQPDADRLALSDAVWVDVQVFEREVATLTMTAPADDQLQSTIELYRAPLLDSLVLSEAPDFEIWLDTERERLGMLYMRALEALVRVYRSEARWADVIPIAQRALAYDNLQESMYRALMEAHAWLGERPEALRQYDRLRAALARELGVEPLPETKALREAIRSGNLEPIASSPKPSASPHRPLTPGQDRPLRLPFVGRQAERTTLDQELELAAGGRARVVLITGELGIGKTRLWEEWSASLPPDAIALSMRCLATTQSLPFAPLVALFRGRPCFEYLFDSSSPVALVWLVELARLLPEIRIHRPEIPAPVALPSEDERHRLFEAFTQVLRALGGQPLVLFVDDLHWTDYATLDWLLYLVRRLQEEPLLLLAACRLDEAPTQLVSLTARWSREGIARRLELGRLTLEESAELIRALRGDVTLVKDLHARSAGNPYFLIELSQGLPEDTPPALADLVRARLGQLPDAARQVLQAAAVLDTDFDFLTLRRVSGRGEEETLDALDVLLEASVLVEQEGRYAFAHPLVATVVRNDLSIARRSFLHRRAAEALEMTHAGRLAPIAGQLVRHYVEAGRPEQAAHYAEIAAERALSLTAPAEAVAFSRQAFSLEPTPARRMRLGHALYMQGDLDAARETLCQALDEFEAAGDRLSAARTCLALAESYLPAGQGVQVIEWVERAMPNLEADLDPEALARSHYLLGAGLMQSGGSLAEAESHLLEAAALADENDLPEMSARSQFELGNLLAQRGHLAAALDAFERTIALAQAGSARILEILGHNNLAYHAHLTGDLALARKHIEIGLAMAEAHALFIPRQYLYSTRGEIALAEGELDEAEAWFNRALGEAEKFNNHFQAANIRANLGLVARARGDLDEALAALEDAYRQAAAISALHLRIQIDLWLAELYLERGEHSAAREALARAEANLAGGERHSLQAWAERISARLG